jgi:hypothetical protein
MVKAAAEQTAGAYSIIEDLAHKGLGYAASPLPGG